MRYYAKLRCMHLRNTFTCPRPCRQQPYSGLSRFIVDVSRPYTLRHITLGTTPLFKGLARRKKLYLTTQHLQETCIPLGEIRTRNPSKQTAADLRLTPRGHPYRHISKYTKNKSARYPCSRT